MIQPYLGWISPDSKDSTLPRMDFLLIPKIQPYLGWISPDSNEAWQEDCLADFKTSRFSQRFKQKIFTGLLGF